MGVLRSFGLQFMRIYLDNAATSWPKPEAVYAAVDRYQRDVGAAAGRGAYRDAVEAQRVVDEARRLVAELLRASSPNRIAFGANGTDVLNLAIHGVLRPGDHVVSTVCEHNSVLRPLAAASRRRDVQVDYLAADGAGYVDPQDVKRVIKKNTRLIAITHASNVTGAIQPIGEIAAIARTAEVKLLVDAAQTLGHVPIDVGDWDVDLLAASGHKGLLGPLGTGILYVRPGLEKELEPMRQGGTGVESTLDRQPDQMPQRFEAGNLNTPALAGLAAAVRFVQERSVEAIGRHESELVARLREGLHSIPQVQLFGPSDAQPQAAVVSFRVKGYDPQDFAAALDGSFGVQCRAGLHCAPRMHAALSTIAGGGLVRLSPGWSTSVSEIEQAVKAVAAIATV